MARDTNPLGGNQIGVVANLPQARLTAPSSNAALDLAQSLSEFIPEARQATLLVSKDLADKARARAQKDAIRTSGAELAGAVKAGILKPTQNPWYVQAYKREAAALTSYDKLNALRTQSLSWESRKDPQAFAAEWRKAVGELAGTFDGPDASAGFIASEAQVTSQALQSNQAEASAAIIRLREVNLGALASDALNQALAAKGGVLTGNDAFMALAPIRLQWSGTGGTDDGWFKIVDQAITATAYARKDPELMDLKKAPELLHGPSEAGAVAAFGEGGNGADQPYTSSFVQPEYPLAAEFDAVIGGGGTAPKIAPPPMVKATAPVRTGLRMAFPVASQFTGVSSGVGPRMRPTPGASRNHKGLDLKTPQGTDTMAQGVGKVISAGKNGGLGNAIVIDYGQGVKVTLGHLSSINVKAGDVVNEMQVIGKSGSTGVSTGPHLHYQMEVNGKVVDPRTFKGQTGGEFTANAVSNPDFPPPETYTGFPGMDKPFVAGQPGNPQHHLATGPSLYGMPGIADATEADRYRITQASDAAMTKAYREARQKREVRGYEATDYLYKKYGTGVLTGAVNRDAIVRDLSALNYSAPEIAAAMRVLKDDMGDSVGVASAALEARGQNPGVAKSILDLHTEGAVNGYSDGYATKVGNALLGGMISLGTADSMITGSMASTERKTAKAVTAENRAYTQEQRADSALFKQYRMLDENADNLGAVAFHTITTGTSLSFSSDPGLEARVKGRVRAAMRAWMGSNPGDFDGALLAGQNEANSIIIGKSGGSLSPAAPVKPGAPNPRRN